MVSCICRELAQGSDLGTRSRPKEWDGWMIAKMRNATKKAHMMVKLLETLKNFGIFICTGVSVYSCCFYVILFSGLFLLNYEYGTLSLSGCRFWYLSSLSHSIPCCTWTCCTGLDLAHSDRLAACGVRVGCCVGFVAFEVVCCIGFVAFEVGLFTFVGAFRRASRCTYSMMGGPW